MSHPEIVALLSGVLQFGVACYALRLNRLFGTTRVGWSLFSAFMLLAAVHLFLSMGPFKGNVGLGMTVDGVYGVVSILLLTGMAHLESIMKQRLAAERAAQRKLSETEAASARKELAEFATRLESEVADRKRIQEQMEKAQAELLAVSRKAGMSEVANGVLHNVGNVLNSVNISASIVSDHIAQLKIPNVARVADLMKENAADLGTFMNKDPRGQQLPVYLADLARHMADQQKSLLEEIEFIKKKIDHIKGIVSTQQNYGRVSGLTEKVHLPDLVEDVLRIHSNELVENKIKLHRDYDLNLPEIIVDKHKVLQIVLNLLTNAKHACVESNRPDKQVTVSVVERIDQLQISVQDNGIGIPDANLKKIFTHGFTTRAKGGHGFGLHSGLVAAQEMGGRLTARSAGPGQGATFTLELPHQPTTNGVHNEELHAVAV